MKITSNLFSKTFDLKPSKIFGGNTTYKDSSATTSDLYDCTDTSYTTSDDNDKQISKCTEYDCEE
ncbi:MAG: hypothetical protein V3U92_14885 [Cellulophaga sp.]